MWKTRPHARTACQAIFLLGALLIVVAVGVAVTRSLAGNDLTTVFSLRREGGVPEFYEYLLAGSTMILLGWVYIQERNRAFLLIAALFGFILLDDSLAFHERFGSLLARRLDLPVSFGLRLSDYGEIAAWAIAGLAFVPLALWSLSRITDADVGAYFVFGAILLGLVFFAVGVDVIHASIRELDVERLFGLVEDGGELLMLCCAAAAAVLYQQGTASRDSRER